jgi:hypothetical protein
MKSFIYFLGIFVLGYVGELRCDNITPILPANTSQNEETLSALFWDRLGDLCEEIAAVVSGNSADNKAAGAPQISKQEFDLLVRKHICEQKIFLRYMQATGISLTCLMVAITAIMGSAFIKTFRN